MLEQSSIKNPYSEPMSGSYNQKIFPFVPFYCLISLTLNHSCTILII